MNEQTHNQSNIKWIIRTILFCVIFTGLFVAASALKSFAPLHVERMLHGLVGTVIALLTTLLFIKLDKTTFASIGLVPGKRTIKHFLIGLLCGIAIMGSLTFSVILFSGFKISINSSTNLWGFLISTMALLPLALMEEIAFRGYPLIVLKNKLGLHTAIFILSILFALYHVANGWPIARAFLGPAVWGIVFSLAAINSKGIAMPTGMHYAANLIPAAFAISSTGNNLFILTHKDGSSLENYHSSKLAVLLPQVALLVFGIICMQWLWKKNKSKN